MQEAMQIDNNLKRVCPYSDNQSEKKLLKYDVENEKKIFKSDLSHVVDFSKKADLDYSHANFSNLPTNLKICILEWLSFRDLKIITFVAKIFLLAVRDNSLPNKTLMDPAEIILGKPISYETRFWARFISSVKLTTTSSNGRYLQEEILQINQMLLYKIEGAPLFSNVTRLQLVWLKEKDVIENCRQLTRHIDTVACKKIEQIEFIYHISDASEPHESMIRELKGVAKKIESVKTIKLAPSLVFPTFIYSTAELLTSIEAFKKLKDNLCSRGF